MFARHCPRVDELKSLATSSSRVSNRVKRHVERCETCNQVVTQLRQDAELIGDLREASLSLDDRRRQEIVEICRKVASASDREG